VCSYEVITLLPCLTANVSGGISWNVGVYSDLWVEDAAMGVRIHLQGVQQLSVMLYSMIICASLFWNKSWSVLWFRETNKQNNSTLSKYNVV